MSFDPWARMLITHSSPNLRFRRENVMDAEIDTELHLPDGFLVNYQLL